MDILLHEDKTHRDVRLKVVLAIPVILFLAPALSYLANNNTEDAVMMLGILVLLFIIFWVIIPRQYLIFDDKLKIIFARPFSFTIPFYTIKKAGVPKGAGFGLNFPSSLSNQHLVEILRLKRMAVYITPADRELFLEKLGKSINNWVKEKKELQ